MLAHCDCVKEGGRREKEKREKVQGGREKRGKVQEGREKLRRE